MGKALVGLFENVDSARSAKIVLESLGITSENAEIILKEEYDEKLHRLNAYGFSTEDINSIDNGFKDGEVVLSVRHTSNYKDVFKSLINSNAKTVFTSTEYSSSSDDKIFNNDEEKNEIHRLENISQADNSISEDDLKLYLHEEKLDISKEKIKSGEIVIRRETIEEIKTIHVPVIREEVVIEKIVLNDNSEKRQEIERIIVMQEEIEIKKSAIIKEKLDIKKVQVKDSLQIRDLLKKEELEII